jgi:hypothetical protein
MRIAPFLSLLCLIATTSLAQKGIKESAAPVEPIVIDGNVDEWPNEWMLDPKGKFLFNVCNDDQNLYLRIKISDNMTQTKIGLFGLTVFLNPEGKKIGKMGLKYPVGKDPNELKVEKAKAPPADDAEFQQRKKDLIQDVEVVELVGFTKQNIVSSRLGLMNGVQVFIAPSSDGAYLYEAKIPFKAYKIDKSKVKVLGLGFVTGKYTEVTKGSANNNTMAPAGGYGGGSPYGPRGYGYGSGYGSGMQAGASTRSYNPMGVSTYMSVGIKLK